MRVATARADGITRITYRSRDSMAEDRKEPPFDGGSQPVPHQKDPVPGPGRSAGQIVTMVLAVVVLAAVLVYLVRLVA